MVSSLAVPGQSWILFLAVSASPAIPAEVLTSEFGNGGFCECLLQRRHNLVKPAMQGAQLSVMSLLPKRATPDSQDRVNRLYDIENGYLRRRTPQHEAPCSTWLGTDQFGAAERLQDLREVAEGHFGGPGDLRCPDRYAWPACHPNNGSQSVLGGERNHNQSLRKEL
jgi:hypothetical protein